MKGLHPEAKALIEAAQHGEAPPPPETLARVQRSVLQRAAAIAGAAALTGSAGAVAKAAVGVSLATKLIVSGAAAAVLSIGLIATYPSSLAPARQPAARPRSALSVSVRAGAARAANSPEVQLPPATAAAASSDRLEELDPSQASGSAAAPLPQPEPRVAGRPDQRARPRALVSERPGSAATREATPSAGAPPLTSFDAPEGTPSAGAHARIPSETADRTSSSASLRLAAELSLLEHVFTALRRGQPEAALDLLERNETIVRDGSFEQEARAAAISALCQLGRERAARAAFQRFRSRWPRTPLATRLQAGCQALGGQ
jgi:hypothetical protein